VPVPVPGPGEILVRLVASGFCHTDHMTSEGAFKTKLPFTRSHEPTGIVAALRPDVSGNWKVGERVGVYLFRDACGTCSGCKWWSVTHDEKPTGRYCENRSMHGIVGRDGGFAEYMITTDVAIMKIPDDLPFERKIIHMLLLLLLRMY
jgi:D-arabinose 1-dehydrogenase-like Zn-dependent alcohol dehydrogenase